MGLVDSWGAWCLTDGSLAEKDFTNTRLAKGLVLPNPKKTQKPLSLIPRHQKKQKPASRTSRMALLFLLGLFLSWRGWGWEL